MCLRLPPLLIAARRMFFEMRRATTIHITETVIRRVAAMNRTGSWLISVMPSWASGPRDAAFICGRSLLDRRGLSCKITCMDARLSEKRSELVRLLQEMERVVVAYSGGVDSSFLADMAHEALGDDAIAITAVSPSLARRELDEAKALATARRWNHSLVGTHEVSREAYARNDGDRCYWCKTELFEVLGPIARERRAEVLVGTNTDDLGDYRPGLRAADENGVRAPMVEVGLSKEEVRALSRASGLPTAEKPASPCLASRFAYGVRVTPAGLRRVDRAEEFVRSLGFEVLRVRDHGDAARLEVEKERVPDAVALGATITAGLKALGYGTVSIDPEGFRSGSLNAALLTPGFGRPQVGSPQ